MSSLHRFFLPNHLLQPDQTVNLELLLHQLQVVLRLQPGVQIVLLDGEGQAFLAEILTLTRKAATGRVLVQLPNPPEPTVQLTLYQCSLKTDKFEWVLQKGVELGVSRFVPVISQRSIVRPATALLNKYTRWQAIIREAAEQCGRGRLPELAEPLDWPAAIAHPHQLRLLPWEAQNRSAASIKAAVTAPQSNAATNPTSVALLIGPEGGITAAEAQAAQTAGWQTVTLGPHILRAETAALTAIVLVMEHLGQQ